MRRAISLLNLAKCRFLRRACTPPHFSELLFLPLGVNRRRLAPTQVGRIHFETAEGEEASWKRSSEPPAEHSNSDACASGLDFCCLFCEFDSFDFTRLGGVDLMKKLRANSTAQLNQVCATDAVFAQSKTAEVCRQLRAAGNLLRAQVTPS